MYPKFKPWDVCVMDGSIVVVGALIRCALLHPAFDLKIAQINKQRSLIREFIFCKFELGYNTAEATKTLVLRKVKAQLITER